MRLGVRDGVILIMNYQLAYTQQHQQQRRRWRKSVAAWATWLRARTCRAHMSRCIVAASYDTWRT